MSISDDMSYFSELIERWRNWVSDKLAGCPIPTVPFREGFDGIADRAIPAVLGCGNFFGKTATRGREWASLSVKAGFHRR
jgi:hypothetical protein